nr:hypothetical protein [Candidatus Sigynarchaeota archaeon]
MIGKTIWFRASTAVLLTLTVLAIFTPVAAAAPGGGTWFTPGAVVLWENKVDEYSDQFEEGVFEWLNRHTDTLRFKAETVVQNDTIVNVTGAYYYYNGHLNPAPNYQNHAGFVPWHPDMSFVIDNDPNSKFQAYWNGLDTSMVDLPAQLDFTNATQMVNISSSEITNDLGGQIFIGSLLLTESLLWTYGQEFPTDEQDDDEVIWDSSFTITSKKALIINYTLHVSKNVHLNGTYPLATNAWRNSSFTGQGSLMYGKTYKVLHTQKTSIQYQLIAFNNDTQVHDITSKQYRQSMYAVYPSEIYKDVDILALVPGYEPAIIGLIVVSSVLVTWRIERKKASNH